MPPIRVEPTKIPPEVEMKAGLPNNKGRFTLSTVGKTVLASLMEWRNGQRLQKIVFDMATALTRDYVSRPDCIVPAHVLFPQLRAIVDRYIREKVEPIPPGEKIDVLISPYYGWVIEALLDGDPSRPVEAEKSPNCRSTTSAATARPPTSISGPAATFGKSSTAISTTSWPTRRNGSSPQPTLSTRTSSSMRS